MISKSSYCVEVHRTMDYFYKVIHTVRYMGWVDMDLELFPPDWWVHTVDTYCPGRMVEQPKSKSTQPEPMYLTA